jgi:hypothetical protein
MTQGTSVKLYWKKGDTMQKWNETCAEVIETFGAPGSKYICHAHTDYMEFLFFDKRDAVYFTLKWG